MQLQTPQNCRISRDIPGVLFEVKINGRNRKGLITTDAIRILNSTEPDLVKTVSTSLEISKGLAKRIAASIDDEQGPILLNSMMLDEKGRWTI